MTVLFISLGQLNLLIAVFILMALLLLAPGIFLFWLGLAALLTGLATFTFGAVLALSWQAQFLLFAALAVAAVPLWRRMARGGAAEVSLTLEVRD